MQRKGGLAAVLERRNAGVEARDGRDRQEIKVGGTAKERSWEVPWELVLGWGVGPVRGRMGSRMRWGAVSLLLICPFSSSQAHPLRLP